MHRYTVPDSVKERVVRRQGKFLSHDTIAAGRCLAIGAGDDFAIGAADPERQRAHQHRPVGGRRLGDLVDTRRIRHSRQNGDGSHRKPFRNQTFCVPFP